MIEALMDSRRAELTQKASKSSPVVLSTRLRLARNMADKPFPERANAAQRRDIMASCARQLGAMSQTKNGNFLEMSQLSDLEKQVLVERHLISRELCGGGPGSAVYINEDQTCAVMINEEDHLRIQFLKSGFNLKSVWKQIDRFDSDLERSFDVAFSSEFGYLTACPTNLGTGLRASVMMHLPGLVISDQMERVVRAVNQLGITVRGLYGEGSEALGHVFQISNQETLGESEPEIIDRLGNVLKTVIDHELNARFKYLEDHRAKLLDQIGRAFGMLRGAYLVNSTEALNLLSLMRLAVDFGLLPESRRSDIDRLFIECQPGHMQYAVKQDVEPEGRDVARADKLRQEFGMLPTLDFEKLGQLA